MECWSVETVDGAACDTKESVHASEIHVRVVRAPEKAAPATFCVGLASTERQLKCGAANGMVDISRQGLNTLWKHFCTDPEKRGQKWPVDVRSTGGLPSMFCPQFQLGKSAGRTSCNAAPTSFLRKSMLYAKIPGGRLPRLAALNAQGAEKVLGGGASCL